MGEPLFWPIRRWRALQEKRFLVHVANAARTDFYQRRIYPGRMKSLADVTLLPLTDKHQLALAGAAAFGCRRADIREWVSTSGTTGKPLCVPLTQSDLHRLAENEAVALHIAGLRADDTLIIAVAMDRLFVAGLAYWLGAQRLGAACMRVGPAFVSQRELLCSLLAGHPRNFVITVPSLLVDCERPADQRAFRNLAAIIGIAEPLRSADLTPNSLAQRLSAIFTAPLLGTYASTETCTTFAEGPQCRGGHLNPSLAVAEIIDERGLPAAPGSPGEVVVTPLGVRGMPLVRFRTGDIAALYTEPCPCGRTTPRLGPILGRRQQLLKVRGTSLFPAAIFDLLNSMPEVRDYAIVARRAHDLSDLLTLHVCLRDGKARTRQRLEQRARAILKVTPRIVYAPAVEIRTLQTQANPRKPSKFVDLRSVGSEQTARERADQE